MPPSPNLSLHCHAMSLGSHGRIGIFWNSGKLLSNGLKNDRLPHVPTVLEEVHFPWLMASPLCTMPFKIFFFPAVSQTKECFQFLRLYLPSLSLVEALSLAFWWLCTYLNPSDCFQLLPLCSRKLTQGNASPRRRRAAGASLGLLPIAFAAQWRTRWNRDPEGFVGTHGAWHVSPASCHSPSGCFRVSKATGAWRSLAREGRQLAMDWGGQSGNRLGSRCSFLTVYHQNTAEQRATTPCLILSCSELSSLQGCDLAFFFFFFLL